MIDAIAEINAIFDREFKDVPTIDPRLKSQLALEQALVDFKPNFTEGQELLDALIAALRCKYPPSRFVVVDEEANALRIALGEADCCGEFSGPDDPMSLAKQGDFE